MMERTDLDVPVDPFAVARRAFVSRLPAHFRRLSWSTDELIAYQTRSLRRLLRLAVARSRFHARRLGDLVGSIDRFELTDLDCLPVMTKAEMMEHFDDVVTDHRLTRSAVDAFVAGVGEQPTALFGDYVVLASGGSSGRRGVFAWPLDVVPDYLATILRSGLARAGGGAVPGGLRVAMVAAGSAIHATRATAHLIDGTIGTVTFAPANLPTTEIVRRVDATQPTLLAGYAGALRVLGEEQLAGRLAIHPTMVVSTSEHLTPEAASVIAEAFGPAPANAFGSSEGLNGSAPPGDAVFTFAGDAAHVEFVDEYDRPVPVGSLAHHVLVTNLLNTAQPLVRYRLDDAMTQQPSLPGNGHPRATLEGRVDEVIRFGTRRVHPITVRSVLVHCPSIIEYQARSGTASLHLDVVASGPIDARRIASDVSRALSRAGVDAIDVTVTPVERLARDPLTGKLFSFVVDTATGAGSA